ncbi:MAG: entericidin A/B family lipoprotein [Pelistega sp.]|nr:entericidin A/B family lipoprotein [Pelistega sp.]
MKKTLAALFVGLLTLGLAACETTQGLGKDIQNAGQKMEKAIEG